MLTRLTAGLRLRGCHAVFCLCLGLALLASGNRGEADVPLNVLFIAVDDLRPELGCYGAPLAQSPHLDRFAATGLLCEQHFVQVATCGASRYALLTGRSPRASGVTRSNTAAYEGASALKADEQAGAQSLPELFRRSGYHTTLIGKISHTADGKVFAYNGAGDGRPELPHAWDQFATPLGSWERGWGIFFAYANGRHRESGRGDQDLMEFVAEKDDDLPDGQLATAAVEQLQKYADSRQPFFLGVGFFKPHLPFVAPRQDWEAFAETDFGTTEFPRTDSRFWHRGGEFQRYDFPFPKSNPLAPADVATTRRAYYACVRYVDRQIGRVLDSLTQTGLAENTVVVVWGDHGWHLGEDQIWGKHTPLEWANRSVLILRIPGQTQAGSRTAALIETLDLYPTLVDYCQPEFQQTSYPLDGRSLRPVIDNPSAELRPVATSYWGNAISLRSATHRLIVEPAKNRTQSPRVELYDITATASAHHNLASERPDIVAELLQHLPDQP